MLALLLALAGATLVAAPAAAHDRLVGSDPADGAQLATAPAQLVLTFSSDVTSLGTDAVVAGPDGSSAVAGPVVVEGRTVTVPLRTDAGAGSYAVTWRATSSDGHTISGELSYSAAGAAAEPAPEPAAQTEPATPPAGAGSGEDDGSAAAAEEDSASGGPLSGSAPAWVTVAVAVAATTAVGTALFLARRLRPTP